MEFFNKLSLALFFGCVSTLCYAQSTAEEITAITERVHILNAQKAEMDLRAQIAARQQELDRYNGLGRFEPNEDQTIPMVKTIEGSDGKMLATIAYVSGNEETIRVGDVIKGKWKVTHIDIRSVHLQRGKDKTRLYLSRAPMTPTAQRHNTSAPVQNIPKLPGAGK